MSKTKRMIYIRDENVDFYDDLENKSDFVNECLKTARLGGVTDLKTVEVEEGPVVESSATSNTVDALAAMRERDRLRLAEYRKKHGLYDPTNSER